ncbi:MAG: type VI secretion system baseplate subunit TssE [Planctomycetota bacterium]|jgi:type VI secretion system protein ImpF
MAEIAPVDRLQPCLLDRLTDDKPEVTKESRDQRVVSLQKYRSAVLRDIEMLFNSRTRPLHDEIYEFNEAARSVLNYGIPDLFGTTVSGISEVELAARVKQTIQYFEPRIAPRLLFVRMVSPSDQAYIRTVSFEIEGELWAQPLPDHLFIKTEVDLETGHYKWKGESGG